MSNIQEQIFRSIETIVDKKIKDLAFDKTIEAVIVDNTKGKSGEYKVRYQDVILTVYSNNNTVIYSENDTVIISVPDGDLSNKKSIVGLKENVGEEFLDVVDIMDKIQRIGYNYVDEKEGFSVSLSTGQDKSIDFRVRKSDMVTDYPGKTNLLIGATIESDLIAEPGGDFGVELDVNFSDTVHTFRLPLVAMKGNPYKLTNKYQSMIFTLPSKNLTEVLAARVYLRGFKEAGSVKFSNLDIQYVKPKDVEGLENYSAKIWTPDGTFFKNGVVDIEQVLKLTMATYKQGEDYNAPAVYKWFYSDPSVTDEFDQSGNPMPGYDSDGGEGWYHIKESDPNYDATAIEIVEEGKSILVRPKAVVNFKVLRCVAIMGGQEIGGINVGFTKLDAIETIVDQTDALNIIIDSSEGDVFKEYGNIVETTLTCKVVLGTEVIDPTFFDYSWSKVLDDGSEIAMPIDPITPQNLTVEVRNDIIDTRNYYCRVYKKI